MTVELSHRFEAIDGHSENRPLIARATNGTVIGRWVPDTRLQAIADAWTAAGQTFPTLRQDPPARGRETIRVFWPELASAIEDALTEEKQ